MKYFIVVLFLYSAVLSHIESFLHFIFEHTCTGTRNIEVGTRNIKLKSLDNP